jgi:hypothetical protein
VIEYETGDAVTYYRVYSDDDGIEGRWAVKGRDKLEGKNPKELQEELDVAQFGNTAEKITRVEIKNDESITLRAGTIARGNTKFTQIEAIDYYPRFVGSADTPITEDTVID